MGAEVHPPFTFRRERALASASLSMWARRAFVALRVGSLPLRQRSPHYWAAISGLHSPSTKLRSEATDTSRRLPHLTDRTAPLSINAYNVGRLTPSSSAARLGLTARGSALMAHLARTAGGEGRSGARLPRALGTSRLAPIACTWSLQCRGCGPCRLKTARASCGVPSPVPTAGADAPGRLLQHLKCACLYGIAMA